MHLWYLVLPLAVVFVMLLYISIATVTMLLALYLCVTSLSFPSFFKTILIIRASIFITWEATMVSPVGKMRETWQNIFLVFESETKLFQPNDCS